MKGCKNKLKDLRRNEEGAVYVMFAVLLVPLIIFAAIAIEVSRTSYINTKLAYAADAGALAGARYKIEDVQANAQKIFYANFPNGFNDVFVIPQISLSSDQSTVRVLARGSMPTIIGSFANIMNLTVKAYAEAKIGLPNKLELALALEVGGSKVNDNKVGEINSAAVHFINALFKTSKTTDSIFASLIPYGATVNITPKNVGWTSNPQNVAFPNGEAWQGCVMAVDTFTTPHTDTPPSSTRKWPLYFAHSTNKKVGTQLGDNDWELSNSGSLQVTTKISGINVGPNRSCVPPLIPLTNDASLLKKAIPNTNVAGGGNFGNLGLVWAWNTLSPKWTGKWGNPDLPRASGGQIAKLIVLVTTGNDEWFDTLGYAPDGDPTAYGTIVDYAQNITSRLALGALGTTNRAQSRTQIQKRLTDLCQRIKDSGVKIAIINYKSTDSVSENNYKQCASTPSLYFKASSSKELQSVFDAIINSLSKIILIK